MDRDVRTPKGSPLMGGFEPQAVKLVAHDDAWAARYREEEARIEDALTGVAVGIEHIGSTSVPGLSAKPIVDIQVLVASFDPWSAYGVPLERLGYQFRDDEEPQHRFFRAERDGVRLVNLHVCEEGSAWAEKDVAFRDLLRRDPGVAEAYEARKRALARLFPGDVHAYAAAKTPFVRAALEGRVRDEAIPPAGPDPDQPVVVLPYDPGWAERYEAEAAAIRSALGPQLTRIEHIGSTSVPGLASKPIVDMLLNVRTQDRPETYVPAMAALGYELRPDFDLPWTFLRNRVPRRTHIHVFEPGSEDERHHLAFRDYLRAHPEDARSYGLLKRVLARDLREDRMAYLEAKAPYIWVLLQRARAAGFLRPAS
jgi:GrpB-like predicted nucleotidyltransferase (UPF0157 family)